MSASIPVSDQLSSEYFDIRIDQIVYVINGAKQVTPVAGLETRVDMNAPDISVSNLVLADSVYVIFPDDVHTLATSLSSVELYSSVHYKFRVVTSERLLCWMEATGIIKYVRSLAHKTAQSSGYNDAGTEVVQQQLKQSGVMIDAPDATVKEVAERTWAASERAKREEALRESEEKFRTLFETIDEALVIVELVLDENEKVTDFIYREENASHSLHSGLYDIIGRRASEVLPGMEPYWLSFFQKIYDTGEAIRGENYNVDTDRWYNHHHSRIGGPGSRLIAAVSTDITERKYREQLQQYLLKFNDAIRPIKNPLEIQTVAATLLGEHLNVNRLHYGERVGDYLYINRAYVMGLPP